MSLPRHHEYKDSGVAWLGKVPAHWQVHRLKNLFEIRKRIVGEEGHPVLSITQRGIKLKDIESNDGQLSMDYSKYQIVTPGDFAMNHMDLLTGFVDISPYAGVTSPDYRVFAVRDGTLCEPRYFLYLLQNGYRQKIFYAFGQGASEFGRWRFPTDQFNDFRFPCPPPDEQTAVATFLDRETGKIDALIAEQEKLLALLTEKRQATISHAVTKGLNPDAPMKDSGAGWLGEVPRHWELRQLKTVSTFTTSGPRGWSDRISEEGCLFIQSGDLNNSMGVEFSTAKRVVVENDAEAIRTQLSDGDVVVCITGAKTGNVAVCNTVPEPAYVNQHLCLIRPGDKAYPPFLAAQLKSSVGQIQFELSQYGLKQGLSLENVRETLIVLPPLQEQMDIAAFLDTETTKLDTLKTESERAIALLKERRSALIGAAVTGQIDVRQT